MCTSLITNMNVLVQLDSVRTFLQLFISLSSRKMPSKAMEFRFSCNISLQITIDINGLSVIEVWK